jgi:fibronectin-binding autotransporter adhesin
MHLQGFLNLHACGVVLASHSRIYLVALIVLSLGADAPAADRYWSGGGTWDTTSQNWGTAPNGPYNQATWSNTPAENPFFEGTAGMVTLGEAITAGSITLGVPGYTIAKGSHSLTATSLAGTGNVTFTGSGQLSITGSSSGYSGTVTLGPGSNAGSTDIVVVGSGDSLGTGTINMRGAQLSAGTASIIVSNAVDVAAGGFRVGGSNSFTLAGPISVDNFSRTFANYGDATVTLGDIVTAGASTVVAFDNAQLGTPGGLIVVSGVISGSGQISSSNANANTRLAGANAFTGQSSISAGMLVLANTLALQNSTVNYTGGSLVFSDAVAGNAFAFGGLSGSTGLALQNNAGTPAAVALTVGGNNAGTTYSGVLSGPGSLTKSGTGTVSLTASSTYTGATTVSTGTLALGNGGTTGGLARESAIEIAAGATLHWNRSNSDTGISNAISGAGTILKSGGGEIAFTGTNTFSGTIDIQAGKLAFSGANSANGAPNVTVATGAIVSLGEGFSNSTATIGSLSGSGRVDPQFGSTTGTRTLSVTGGTFAGRLTDADSGSIRLLALTKAGLDTLTLSGTNTYTGATTVSAGTLLVNGSLANTSGVSVASAATLGGSGSIGGPTSILAGGILSPGTSPGTLTITNTLSLADTSILNFEIDAADPSSSVFNDLITGVTDLTLGGTLDLTGSGDFSTVPAGTLWRLINYSGTLTDNTLAIGTAPTLAAGLSFSVDTATDGQVNLVVVPEPGPLALAALGLAAGLGWLRRRQA